MPYGWTQATQDGQIVQRNLAHKGGFVVVGARITTDEASKLLGTDDLPPVDTFTNEDDSSSTGYTSPVTLKEHTAGVVEFADHFSRTSRLPVTTATDIQLAARLHDIGKADPRFQAWLAGGNLRAVRLTGELLAKSGMSIDRTANRLARERSGYPPGGRHELLSVRLIECATEWLSQAHDPELVLHLVAAHHGSCRPFAPVVNDLTAITLIQQFDLKLIANLIDLPIPAKATVNADEVLPTRLEQVASGVTERFWTLVRRYGWWGLAWLETHPILADRCESQREQEAVESGEESEATT
jgi:CRISPR-associated endonuclease/helicase Cas3